MDSSLWMQPYKKICEEVRNNTEALKQLNEQIWKVTWYKKYLQELNRYKTPYLDFILTCTANSIQYIESKNLWTNRVRCQLRRFVYVNAIDNKNSRKRVSGSRDEFFVRQKVTDWSTLTQNKDTGYQIRNQSKTCFTAWKRESMVF